jgi:hypothetical protein
MPYTINHNRKLPPVKQVFPMGRLFFSKDSHGMYFEFDKSAYNDDLNMAQNFAPALWHKPQVITVNFVCCLASFCVNHVIANSKRD